MSSCLGDWSPGVAVRFGLAYERMAREDEERSAYLAQRCRLRSARGLPPAPPSRETIHVNGSTYPSDKMAMQTWTDPGTCAICRRVLSAGPNGQGRPNKTGICKRCHDSIGASRRQAVYALVAERRAQIAIPPAQGSLFDAA